MTKRTDDRTAKVMIVVMIILTALTSYLFNISMFTNSNTQQQQSPATQPFLPFLVLVFLAFAVCGIGGWLYAFKKIDRHR